MGQPISRPEGTHQGRSPGVLGGAAAPEAQAQASGGRGGARAGWGGAAGREPSTFRQALHGQQRGPPLAHPLSRPLSGGAVQPIECRLPAPHTPGGSADLCQPPFSHLSSFCPSLSAPPSGWGGSWVNLSSRLMFLWDHGAPWWQGRATMFPYIPSPEQGQEVPVYKMDEGSPPSSCPPPPIS